MKPKLAIVDVFCFVGAAILLSSCAPVPADATVEEDAPVPGWKWTTAQIEAVSLGASLWRYSASDEAHRPGTKGSTLSRSWHSSAGTPR